MVNPDEVYKTTGKIVQNIVISLLLLIIMPTLFNYAFSIQNIIVEDNVIPHLIFGDNTNNSISSTGKEMALVALKAFVQIPDSTENDNHITWGEIQSVIRATGNFQPITEFTDVINDNRDGARYIPLVSTICGGFLIYIALSFCLDLGVRVVKLAFYQITAPVPIILRVIPSKKSVFDNWVKKTLATFFEVFVRIFTMYMICAFVVIINDSFHSFISDSNLNFVAKVIIFMGMFAFGKQAPKLIGEVTGINSGNMSLGIRNKLKNSGPLGNLIDNVGQRTVGAVTGAAGAVSLGIANGSGLSSLGYGFANGWKGKGGQFSKQRNKFYNDIMGQTGKPGLFGGKPLVDTVTSKAKDNANKYYRSEVEGRIDDFENSSDWINEFNRNYAKQHQTKEDNIIKLENQYQQAKNQYQADANRKIVALQRQQHHAEEVFETQRGDRIMTERQRYMNDKKAFEQGQQQLRNLESQFETEKAKFNSEKEAKIKELSMKAMAAQNNHDIMGMQKANTDIDKLKNAQYNNDELMQKINELKSKTFDESSYQARLQEIKDEKFDDSNYTSQINNLRKDYHDETMENSINEARRDLSDFETAFNSGDRNSRFLTDVREATVSTMRKGNAKYKADKDFINRKEQERMTKEYMDSQEGKNQIAAWQKAMENYEKSNKTAPLPPAGNKK